MRGLSRRNLVYMRTFAAAFGEEITQQPVAQLPWGHVTILLDKLDEQVERDWYAAAAGEHGWSRNVLLNQIMCRQVPHTAPDQEAGHRIRRDTWSNIRPVGRRRSGVTAGRLLRVGGEAEA